MPGRPPPRLALPLFRIWGALADRVPCYGSGGWGKYAEKDLVAEAERYAGMGCRSRR